VAAAKILMEEPVLVAGAKQNKTWAIYFSWICMSGKFQFVKNMFGRSSLDDFFYLLEET
jgi:hypothetical protein